MLRGFIVANSAQIVECAQRRASQRAALGTVPASAGMASFLSHVSELLGQSPDDTSRLVPTRGPLAGITDSAMLAGHQALRDGVSIATLVNSYTDAREVVIDLVGAAIAVDMRGFHLFNECVDCAIAGAVSAYGMQRERDLAYDGTERLGVLAHEMRNLLNTMTLSFAVIREGKVGLSGSTGAMLSRSLSGLCALVDRSVAEVRLETSSPALVPVSMVEFMEQIQVSAAVHAEGYGRQLTVHPVDRELSVVADWQLLESAVSNLLQNAFKFSRGQGQVSLVTRATADRVLIDVSDECGGLPAEAVTALFRPFSRAGSDRSGLGLGLFIAQAAARANLGEISVCDKPGTGCVFTIDLPRSSAVALAH